MKYTKTIRASRQPASRRSVRASKAALRRRAIKADEEFEEDIDFDEDDLPAPEISDDDIDMDEASVTVDDAATELLFEAEDVAELVSEVSGLPVDVTVDEDEVTFTVGEDEYTVTPEGDEEIVEESTSVRARRIAASRRSKRPMRKVAASRRTTSRRSRR